MFNVRRAITPTVSVQFMCSACCLIVLYICMQFRESLTVSEFWNGHEYMVEMAMFNVERVITP